MRRYLNETNYERFISDFRFLFGLIRNSYGDLDLRLRDNYFNLYYRGNSMLKVDFQQSDYKISIHRKFCSGVFEGADPRLESIVENSYKPREYVYYYVPPSLLHVFVQRAHLDRLASRIKNVNQGEETTFEHALITDNMNRQDYMIIDRQITEPGLGYRMDLLGLSQREGSTYSLEVIEVKMGNNRDLVGPVGDQIETYVQHVRDNVEEWASSYEQTYYQLRQTDIFDHPEHDTIHIQPEVSGRVVVMGYSGRAEMLISKLKEKHPSVRVQQMSHQLEH